MSREKKFTPGPWNISGDVIIVDEGRMVCGTYHYETHPYESKANANLIAAAPELLEALENALRVIDCEAMSSCCHLSEDGGCGGEDEDCDWLINAKEAIAKAYGETK